MEQPGWMSTIWRMLSCDVVPGSIGSLEVLSPGPSDVAPSAASEKLGFMNKQHARCLSVAVRPTLVTPVLVVILILALRHVIYWQQPAILCYLKPLLIGPLSSRLGQKGVSPCCGQILVHYYYSMYWETWLWRDTQ